MIGSLQAFNLSIINEDVLFNTHTGLMIKLNSDQHKLIQSAIEKFSQLNDRANTTQTPAINTTGPSHSCSLSGHKCPISPPCVTPQYSSKKAHSFQAQNPQQQQQLGKLISFLLSICAVCLGRHKHDVTRCSASCTWDNKHDIFSEHVSIGLYSKTGKPLCAKWQRASGCGESHCPLHICSRCGSKSHGAQHCPHTENPLPLDTIQI